MSDIDTFLTPIEGGTPIEGRASAALNIATLRLFGAEWGPIAGGSIAWAFIGLVEKIMLDDRDLRSAVSGATGPFCGSSSLSSALYGKQCVVNFLLKTIAHRIAHTRMHASTIPAMIPAPRV